MPNYKILWPWDSRERLLQTIRDCAVYVYKNAENILGEYPGYALEDMTISIILTHGAMPTVNVSRNHFAAITDTDGIPCSPELSGSPDDSEERES